MNKKVKSNQIHDVNKDVTQIKKNAWKKTVENGMTQEIVTFPS